MAHGSFDADSTIYNRHNLAEVVRILISRLEPISVAQGRWTGPAKASKLALSSFVVEELSEEKERAGEGSQREERREKVLWNEVTEWSKGWRALVRG